MTIQSGNFKKKKKKKEKKIIAHQPQTETLIRDNTYILEDKEFGGIIAIIII